MRSLLRRSSGEKDPYLAFPSGISQVRGDRRLEQLAKFNQRFGQEERYSSRFEQTSIEDAVRLMRSPALEAFELDKVDSTTLERYGDTNFGRGALMAKRLVEKGVRFVQVNRGGLILTVITSQRWVIMVK